MRRTETDSKQGKDWKASEEMAAAVSMPNRPCEVEKRSQSEGGSTHS